jgi:hypothetical protein
MIAHLLDSAEPTDLKERVDLSDLDDFTLLTLLPSLSTSSSPSYEYQYKKKVVMIIIINKDFRTKERVNRRTEERVNKDRDREIK